MTEAAETPKAKKRGVGTVINEAILAGKTNEQALEAAKAEFPDAKTNIGTVSWYRNKLRKDGHDVPKAREAKKAASPCESGACPAPEVPAEEADPLG